MNLTVDPACLEGVWLRLLEEAPPLGTGGTQDRTTAVFWTQSRKSGIYVDIRLPLNHPGRPDTASNNENDSDSDSNNIPRRPSALVAEGYSAEAKDILLRSHNDAWYRALLEQQSFAGRLNVYMGDTTSHQVAVQEDRVLRQISAEAESAAKTRSTSTSRRKSSQFHHCVHIPPLVTCHWERHLDCQPPSLRFDIGVCAPQIIHLPHGSTLLRETGDDGSYAEDWLRRQGTMNSDDDSSPVMAAMLESENGETGRQGYWVWTANSFAYAIGYPTSVEQARIQSPKGQTLGEFCEKFLAQTENIEKEAMLDITGSFLAVVGEVRPCTNLGRSTQWEIQYSTHAEVLGCSLLTFQNQATTKDGTACSFIEAWDNNHIRQRIQCDNGQSIVRVWRIKEQENVPFVSSDTVMSEVYGMDPHPDYVDVDIPRTFSLPSFHLTPLSPANVEEDYHAVVASTDVLQGLLGNEWPLGLTKEDNIIDLSWHEREFTLQRSFSWIVRDTSPASALYLGCAYVFPHQGCRGKAKVVTWIRERPDREILLKKLNKEFKIWLRTKLEGLHISLE